MKKIIKKLLQSRVENEEDFKIKNVALSKRSYQYLETLGNKCFKRLIELSIATRLQRLDKIEKQKPKEREMNVDQQDLLSAITIIMPSSPFLNYCYYSITQSTTPTTTTPPPAITTDTTIIPTPTSATEAATETTAESTTITTATTAESTSPTTTTTTTTTTTIPTSTTTTSTNTTTVSPKFFTRSYVRYKIEKQQYAGNYKYSKCFTISLAALMDFIFTEIIDCVLFNILSINKRKNIIDIMDILKTIKHDDELYLFTTCLYNGEPSEHSEFKENKTEFLVDVIKQLMVSRDKQKRFRIQRPTIFQEYNRYFKHTLKESYRNNRAISVNTNVTKQVKVNYSLGKQKGKSIVKKHHRPIPPKKIEKDYHREEDDELYPDDKLEYTKEGLSKFNSDMLKDILRSKDLKVTGNKTMLIERLIEYKQNKDKEEKEEREEMEKEEQEKEQGESRKKLKLVTKKTTTVITKDDVGIFNVETKEIERQDTVQPSNNVYFDTDDEGYSDYNDDEETNSNDSFICGDYFSDSEIGSDDNCKGDNGVSSIYQYDFNKYYKDQLSKENQSDEITKLFKKKSPRWFWKNRKDTDDTQYKLEELVESDSEMVEDKDGEEEEVEEEEEEDENPAKDDDDSAESADESDGSAVDSADLFDYDACYDELILTDPTIKKYTPHNLFKNRHKLGLGDHTYENFRK